jgi:hypothetical protein
VALDTAYGSGFSFSDHRSDDRSCGDDAGDLAGRRRVLVLPRKEASIRTWSRTAAAL